MNTKQRRHRDRVANTQHPQLTRARLLAAGEGDCCHRTCFPATRVPRFIFLLVCRNARPCGGKIKPPALAPELCVRCLVLLLPQTIRLLPPLRCQRRITATHSTHAHPNPPHTRGCCVCTGCVVVRCPTREAKEDEMWESWKRKRNQAHPYPPQKSTKKNKK